MMEFHILRAARERYEVADALFSYDGNVVFADLSGCRALTYRMNEVREAAKYPERAVHAGAMFAMGLIDEASHVVIEQYRKQFDPEVMTAALAWFGEKVGAEKLELLLLKFVENFPGQTVMRGDEKPTEWLKGSTEGMPHRAAAMEELLMLWTANRNEAFNPFEELFDERSIAAKTVYREVTRALPGYFATRPLIPVEGARAVNLLELLRAPAERAPKSLSEQLALIRRLWRPLLGDSLDRILMIAGEILREEELAIWMQFNPAAAQARTAADEAARRRRERGEQQWPSLVSRSDVPVFGDPAHEYEKFSADTAWMPSTVLIAKSTYVWLAQLSRKYGRKISRLDEIPDEDLAQLAHR
ncbi:MAG: alpha-amylase, partial [Terracidiphilus sp.]